MMRCRFCVRTLMVGVAFVAGICFTFRAWREAPVPLLGKQDGPFMVLAANFRGPGAGDKADALARELRRTHHLPASVFFIKPGRGSLNAQSDAAVLVDGGKSKATAQAMLLAMKRIASVPIQGSTSKPVSLKRSLVTMNPLVPQLQIKRLLRSPTP